MQIDQYWKPIIALIASIAAAVAAGVGAGELGDLSAQDWVGIILVILGGTATVWFAENITGLAGGIIKAVLAAGTAFLTALSTGYATDGAISQGELLVAISAFLVALAVTYQVPGPVPETAAVVPTQEVGGTRVTPADGKDHMNITISEVALVAIAVALWVAVLWGFNLIG